MEISLDAAIRTPEATTQNGVRSILHDTLHRIFRTNDRQLCYRRLPCDMFTDILEAAEPSWHRRSRYAQVFATKFCWVQVFPMQKKSDAHKGLFWLAARDGIPAAIVMLMQGNIQWETLEKKQGKWGVISRKFSLTHLGRMQLRTLSGR